MGAGHNKNARNGKQYIRGQRYPITVYGFVSHWRYATARAGVKARIHDMRHTAATRTLRETGNLRLVQKLLGHTDIKITAEFYADVLVEDLREGMERTSAAAPRIPEAEKSRGKSRGASATTDKPLRARRNSEP